MQRQTRHRRHFRQLHVESLEDRRLLAVDLLPVIPSGWLNPIVISNVTGTNTDNSITTSDTVYCDFAWANNGSTAAGAFRVDVYVDGGLYTYANSGGLAAGYMQKGEDWNMGQFGPGAHTIQLRVDSLNSVSESNESNNNYTRTFNVTGTATVNLTPYQPSGWSDEIVISKTTGTHTNDALTTNDTLYMDWAVINNGNSATTAAFYTNLYLDGSYVTRWLRASGLGSGYYTYVEDVALGTLKAGTHTLQIVADATGTIAETNESDNTFTVSFSVSQANTTPVIRGLPDVTLTEDSVFPAEFGSLLGSVGDEPSRDPAPSSVSDTGQRATVLGEATGGDTADRSGVPEMPIDASVPATFGVPWSGVATAGGDWDGTADFGPATLPAPIGFDGQLQAFRPERISAMAKVGEDPSPIFAEDSSESGTRYRVFEDWGGTWVDAEKDTQAGDDLMCWAGSAANGLWWTQWGLTSGMTTTDQMFQYYQDHWTDLGGLQWAGWSWWFDGVNPYAGVSGASQVDVPGGNFYPAYDPDVYIHSRGQGATANQYAMIDVDTYLRAGYAVGLGVFGSIKHAITAWGFNYDTAYAPSSPYYYKGLWISDSDDNKNLSDGNTAPDVLHYFAVTWDSVNLRYNFDSYAPGSYIGEVDGLEIIPPTASDLWGYTRDGETADSGLTYTILSQSDPNVNATITGSRYLQIDPVDNWNGISDVTVKVSDPSGSYTTDTFRVTVNGVNDAPVLDNTGTMFLLTIDENYVTNPGSLVSDIILSAGGDRITDVDTGALEGIAVTAATHTGTDTGHWEYSTNGGSTWADVGTVSGTQSLLLRATDKLRFYPDTKNAETASVTFRAWDQSSGTYGTKVSTSSNGGTTAFSTATESATITVNGLNDAPVLATGTFTLTAINEDSTTSSGDPVSAIISSAGGDKITDVDTGAVEGIAVTEATHSGAGTGHWEFSINNGSSWSDVGTVSGTESLLLRAIDKLRFVPDAIDGETATVTFRAWDQTVGTAGAKAPTSGNNGGTSPYSTATAIASITVSAVNDPPTSAANAVTTDEDIPYAFLAADFSFIDVDPGDTWSAVKITTLETAGTLEWNNGTSWQDVTLDQEVSKADVDAGRLRFTPAPDANGSPYATFGFKVKDTGGPALSSAAYTMTVNVTPVDDGTLNATLVAGTLTVADGAGVPNALTVSRVDANLVITDAAEQFASAPAGGTLSNNNQTLTIPLTSITGSLVLELGGGDDELTVGFAGGNPIPAAGLSYDGGLGSDALALAGGTFDTSTYMFASASAGSIALDPDGAGPTAASTIAYTALEPVSDNLDADHRVFSFTGAAETITLTDVGGADGNSQIVSTLGESVTFANPTASLTVAMTAGTGADAINVEGLDAAFDADFFVAADTDDTLRFQTNPTGVGTGDLDLKAGNIHLTKSLTTTGSARIEALAGSILGDSASSLPDLVAAKAALIAETGIDLELQVGSVEADSGSGATFLQNAGALVIGGVTGDLNGMVADDEINVVVTGNLTVSEPIVGTTDDAYLVLEANAVLVNALVSSLDAADIYALEVGGEGIVVNADIEVAGIWLETYGSIEFNASVLTNGGHATARASDDITFSSSGRIDAEIDPGWRPFIELDAGRDLIMADGSAIDARVGEIQLFADGNLRVGTLRGDWKVSLFTADGWISDGTAGLGGNQATAGGFFITAGGTVDVRFDADWLGTDTAKNDSPQFLEAIGTVTLSSDDLTAGTGTITLGAGTFLTVGDPDPYTDASIFSNTQVNSGATLAGTGTVSGQVTVQAGGNVAPGASPGRLAVDNSITFTGGATPSRLAVEINGSAASTNYDQLTITGAGRTVALNNAALDVTVDVGYVPSMGTSFTIIDVVDSSSAVAGAFAGLGDGRLFLAGTTLFRIDYNGGTGNDVTLTVAPLDPPTALDLAAEDDTGSDGADNVTKNTTDLTISGLAEIGVTVELFADADHDGVVDSGESLGTTTVAGGSFTKDVSLAAGTHQVKAIQTDVAGHVSAASAALNITIDTTPPAVTVNSLMTNEATPAITGTVSDGTLQVVVNG
ncbi:MAG: hypothetical protein GX575_32920, partial [Candidatus Anammoximicrobium sp.]|nr:hypothetical protein [Candidatus Anammoximicrobium sp.]